MHKVTARRVRLTLLMAVGLAGTALTATAADMSEADRLARCDNNRQAITALQTQIGGHRPFMSDEEIARARTMMTVVGRWSAYFLKIRDECQEAGNQQLCPHKLDPDRQARYQTVEPVLGRNGVTCPHTRENVSDFEMWFQWQAQRACMHDLQAAMAKKIDTAVAAAPVIDRLRQQMARHQSNLVALRCGERGVATAAAGQANGTIYDLVDTAPDKPDGGWTVHAGDIEETVGPDKASFTWTPPPPQQIGANGFSVTMSVSSTAATGSRLDAGIGGSGGMTPAEAKVEVLAESGQTRQDSVTAHFTPPQGAARGTRVSLKIGAFWGKGVTYIYQAR